MNTQKRRKLATKFAFSYFLLLLSLQARQSISFVRLSPLTNDPSDVRKFRSSRFRMSNRQEDAQVEEEVRIGVLGDRRKQIRFTLQSAEKLRNFRLSKGYVPELDAEGKPIKSDGKTAVGLTAFVVAGGAVALRIGGRAALISGLGLDFIKDNAELKNNLDQILMYSDNMDPLAKAAAFVAAWTAVKLFCIDFLGVALAISSGIVFGGVLQGAVASAAAATIGSFVAFTLAKLDSPVRKKALEVLDEYPSLRGIEKVVSRDGLKAILTLRLAPVLPIPIGLYNYIYGVTDVPVLDFAGGIFLGSLKPYLLDSYLGYFGKSVVDGSIAEGTSWQDVILLTALGVSVLVGVFASQLAAETWDSVLEEVEEEKRIKEPDTERKDGVIREVLGYKLPQWIVGFQLSLQQADLRMDEMILDEYEAEVWNYTKDELPPAHLDPAKADNSPEVVGANQGIDYVAGLCDGLVLSPKLFTAFWKYSDPLYDGKEDEELRNRVKADSSIWLPTHTAQISTQYMSTSSSSSTTSRSTTETTSPDQQSWNPSTTEEVGPLTEKSLLRRLDDMQARTQKRLKMIEEYLAD